MNMYRRTTAWMILRGLGDDMDLVGMCCATCAVCFPTSPSAQSTDTYRLLLPLLNIVLCTLAPTKTYIGKFPVHTYCAGLYFAA